MADVTILRACQFRPTEFFHFPSISLFCTAIIYLSKASSSFPHVFEDEEGAVAVPLSETLKGEFVWIQSARARELSKYRKADEELGLFSKVVVNDKLPVKIVNVTPSNEALEANKTPERDASCNDHTDQIAGGQNKRLNEYEELQNGIQVFNVFTEQTASTDTSRIVARGSTSSDFSTADTLCSQGSGST